MQFKECFFQRFPLDNLKSVFTKPDKDSTTKARTVFAVDEFKDDNGHIIAEISYLEDLPILTFYTSDPILKAQAQAKLTAKYMIELYNAFMQFLPLVSGIKTKEFKWDPIKFVGEEIRRRQLNFEYVDTELHYMLIEFNAYIVEQNKTAYSGLGLKLFTMDDLKAFLALCDVYKGIGCSAALRMNDSYEYEFIRNLDWEPFNKLANHTLGLMTSTGHEDRSKPQHVFSITFTPGILGLSMVNDKGLIITLNEATKMQTKRENANPNAIPQFILVRQLIENCTTLGEVETYLQTHQPATSHILSIMDREGNFGIFEMLPNKGPFANDLYHLRKPKSNMVHVSNHFLDDNDSPINGSEGFDCSFIRFLDMDFALSYNKSALDIARSTNVHDSIQTLIFSRKGEDLKLKLNWANGYSATAVDPVTHQLNYTEMEINKEFATYAKQSFQQNRALTVMPEIHQHLIQLMQLSHVIGHTHPQLGYDMNEFYSELVTLLVGQKHSESGIHEQIKDMLKLIHSVRQKNVQFCPQNPQADYSKGLIPSLLLMSPLLGAQTTVVICLCMLAYQNSETLTNCINGKSRITFLREKIANEMQRHLNEVEKPSMSLSI